MPDWFIFSEYFFLGGLVSVRSRWFKYQSRIAKKLSSSCKAANTCECASFKKIFRKI